MSLYLREEDEDEKEGVHRGYGLDYQSKESVRSAREYLEARTVSAPAERGVVSHVPDP